MLEQARINELERAIDEQSRLLAQRESELSRLAERLESLQLQVIGWQSAAEQSYQECRIWKQRYNRIRESYIKRSA